jgi:hypothetical protein
MGENKSTHLAEVPLARTQEGVQKGVPAREPCPGRSHPLPFLHSAMHSGKGQPVRPGRLPAGPAALWGPSWGWGGEGNGVEDCSFSSHAWLPRKREEGLTGSEAMSLCLLPSQLPKQHSPPKSQQTPVLTAASPAEHLSKWKSPPCLHFP